MTPPKGKANIGLLDFATGKSTLINSAVPERRPAGGGPTGHYSIRGHKCVDQDQSGGMIVVYFESSAGKVLVSSVFREQVVAKV
jgi:hypothetical protein